MQRKNLLASLAVATVLGPKCDTGYITPTKGGDHETPAAATDLAGERAPVEKQGNDAVVR